MRVEAPAFVKLYEHVSLLIVVFNRWTEDIDVLVMVKESPDYAPLDWDRDSSTTIIGNGELQVLSYTFATTLHLYPFIGLTCLSAKYS